ncbi:MAG: prolipoprotein diacylglyceryl transferase [Flavobacteriia bacterium]|nr:prolipoprotein diacylglyceryl transferase [Flavobacteriia bacterium]
MNFFTITWAANEGLPIAGDYSLRWYSLLFALGFVLGFQIMLRYFKREGIPSKMLDTMLVYTVVATIVGARLGHVFFYGWDQYKNDLVSILYVWEGGLASHGAAVALIISMYLLAKKFAEYFDAKVSNTRRALWLLDRLVITVALAGCFIRLGNWMNSEIYGEVGNSALQTVFVEQVEDRLENYLSRQIESAEMTPIEGSETIGDITYPLYQLSLEPKVIVNGAEVLKDTAGAVRNVLQSVPEDMNAIVPQGAEVTVNPENGHMEMVVYGVPRHPTQLYEAAGYLVIFVILYMLFRVPSLKYRNGFFLGAFLVLIFGFRFGIEYLKEIQDSFEADWSINQGQRLSIPLVIIGIILLIGNVQIAPKGVQKNETD